MRKMKYLLMGLLVIVPFKISASSLSLGISCEDGYAGDTVSCTVSATSSGNINGVSGNFGLGGLTYSGFSVAVSANVNQVTSSGFALGNTSGFPASFTIGTLKVTIPSSAQPGTKYTVGVNSISGSDTNYDDVSVGSISDTVTVKEKQTTQETNSQTSSNTTSSNNTSTNNNVSNNSTTETNTSDVKSSENKTTTNKESNKKENRSSNNNLKSIKLSSGNMEFLPYVTEYEVNVEYSVDSVTISYDLEDSKASAKLEGSEKLNVGENTFKIKVTAEDGSEKVYVIKINRKEEGETLSSNNYLQELKIDGYNISFDKEKLDYSIKIKGDKELKIDTLVEDDKSSVAIEGNDNLKDGSIIKVKVTAEDGSVRIYNIKVEKSKGLLLPIISCSIAFMALVVVVILTIKKKKNKQK